MRCDFFKPLLTESKVNNKNAFKKKRDWARGEKKTTQQLFSGIIPSQCQEQEAAPCISRGARRKQLLRQLDGKGASKSSKLIYNHNNYHCWQQLSKASCLRGTGSQDSLSQGFRGSSPECEVTAPQPTSFCLAPWRTW